MTNQLAALFLPENAVIQIQVSLTEGIKFSVGTTENNTVKETVVYYKDKERRTLKFY